MTSHNGTHVNGRQISGQVEVFAGEAIAKAAFFEQALRSEPRNGRLKQALQRAKKSLARSHADAVFDAP